MSATFKKAGKNLSKLAEKNPIIKIVVFLAYNQVVLV